MLKKLLSRYMAKIGSKGGKTKGASKRRGDVNYYRRIARKKRKPANND